MSIKDGLHELLDRLDNNTEQAALEVYEGSKETCLYVLQLGLEHVTARRRATKRRELRSIVQPEFIGAPSSVTGRVPLTKKAQQRIVDHGREFFAGWMINATINMGDATKHDLLLQAESERNSAKGKLNNAGLYEALAAPLVEGQRVREYWNPEQVIKLGKDFGIKKSA